MGSMWGFISNISKYAFCILFIAFFSSTPSFTQGNSYTISGRIIDEKGQPIPFATVALEDMSRGTTTNEKGYFQLIVDSQKSFDLIFNCLGYENRSESFDANSSTEISIILKTKNQQIDEVTVRGNSKQELMRRTGYAIDVLETKKYKSSPANLDKLIKQTSGIHIRESGGLGSGFNISLNGLTGNQIRYFENGIPMENMGTSLTINNYPINLVQQVEVYKGVVPISLASDALGGAINIVTPSNLYKLVDASYTMGSFNTHMASLNAQIANKKKDLFLKILSFYNHSDNNYLMHDMPVYDENGNNTGEIDIKRFHDGYTSAMGSIETGLVNRELADKFIFKILYGENQNNYQNPDNNIYRVFGDFHTQSKTLLFSSFYEKRINNFDVKAYILGGEVNDHIIDTGTFKYNWAGLAFERQPDDPKGELFERRSLFKMKDKTFRSQIGIDYSLFDGVMLNLNYSQNYLRRKGEDEVDLLNQSFTTPNSISKQIIGSSVEYKSLDKKVNASMFAKQYWFSGTIESFDVEGNRSINNPSFDRFGFGGLVSWNIYNWLLLKASFEEAYRLPESYEILGDGKYVNSNPTLEPESSFNFNLGSRLNYWINETNLKAEVNFFNRNSRDFIRFKPLGPFGEYENLNQVLTQGIEFSSAINYNNFLMLDVNITYQNLTDQTEFDEGLPNTNYKSRIPNVPYFFGNARLGISPNKKEANNKLTFYWNTRYVHEFFLTWESLGNPNLKYTIPSQLVHDFTADYGFYKERCHVSLTISNLTNELAYDNFSIQKPGRAFYLKVNYLFNNKLSSNH